MLATLLACAGLSAWAQWLASAVAAVFYFDILTSHAAHLLIKGVNASGAGMTRSVARLLVIASLNILAFVLIFAIGFRHVEAIQHGLPALEALSVSLSSLTTSGLATPKSEPGVFLSHLEVITGLFMVGVVLSTVLGSIEPRKQLGGDE